MTGRIRIGTQGWNYSAWVGPFYPAGTRARDMLSTYARAFDTVEVDSTFYAIPPEPTVSGWRDRVPEHFRFSLKVPQEITHECRLVDAQDPLLRFLDRIAPLGDRIGVLLLQMAPDWAPTPATRGVLSSFLPTLSREFRWAMEFRDHRWMDAETHGRLKDAGVGLALADGRWVRRKRLLDWVDRPTADFAYIRWMGDDRRITDYSHVQIERDDQIGIWAGGLRRLAERVRTVFGYCNNHYQGHSPHTARALQTRLGQQPVEPASLRVQADLFEPAQTTESGPAGR